MGKDAFLVNSLEDACEQAVFDRESPVKGCVCFITDSEEVII